MAQDSAASPTPTNRAGALSTLSKAKTIGPAPERQSMRDFENNHPILSTIGSILSGGATDMDFQPGPVDVGLAALPFLPGLPKALLESKKLEPFLEKAFQGGFKEPVWHGTRRNFRQFQSPIRNDYGDFGIHVATKPDTANMAVSNGLWNSAPAVASFDPGANVMPLLARIQKPLEVQDVGLFKTPGNWLETAFNNKQAMVKSTNDADTLEEILKLAKLYRNPPGVQHDPTRVLQFQQDLRNLMQERGYDALKYKNVVEGTGEPSYALLDPRQLKSIWAQFSPEDLGKDADLLKALVGPAVGYQAMKASDSAAPSKAQNNGSKR